MTSAGVDEARKIAEALVQERLAACVNIVESCKSIYRWKGEICREDEVLLIAKTHVDRFDRLKDVVTELHGYDVPEIISLPIDDGADSYMSFLADALRAEEE